MIDPVYNSRGRSYMDPKTSTGTNNLSQSNNYSPTTNPNPNYHSNVPNTVDYSNNYPNNRISPGEFDPSSQLGKLYRSLNIYIVITGILCSFSTFSSFFYFSNTFFIAGTICEVIRCFLIWKCFSNSSTHSFDNLTNDLVMTVILSCIIHFCDSFGRLQANNSIFWLFVPGVSFIGTILSFASGREFYGVYSKTQPQIRSLQVQKTVPVSYNVVPQEFSQANQQVGSYNVHQSQSNGPVQFGEPQIQMENYLSSNNESAFMASAYSPPEFNNSPSKIGFNSQRNGPPYRPNPNIY
eukprot:TRINITY_DN17_c0_g1_i1.p1 TRINITY_DN17_c0_g1~~TRINITY_DN17_c0_g1_i1.p1  ORF type:complete len:306 (+),score=40.34 TRINITY_DN17_c0_g1_i1:34-918(+)